MSKVFFIATAHPEYRGWDFPKGSVVIDPWRMITDQEGVTVRRIGENKPALISILIPSRGRPLGLMETIVSAYKRATHQRRVEFVVRLDADDPRLSEYMSPPIKEVKYLQGERIILSQAWNECAEAAEGEILMHCGDDIMFRTPGWDQQVRGAFAACEDKILLVQGDDLSPNREALATHGFLHRRWVETVGYFLPPLFSCDWNDVWLTEVADALGRRVMLPFVTEHRHYSFGLRERDGTDEEREDRGREDGVVNLYKRTAKERARDVARLKAVIA